MDKPTQARLTEIAETLEAMRQEVRMWESSDYEWLMTRLRNAVDEAKFMIHMKFLAKSGKAGLKSEKSASNPS